MTGKFLVLAAAVILTTPCALAAPGFIGSSRISVVVDDADALADIEIRLNCKANYLRHDPAGAGDRLRIYLEPTTICNGVSPLVAESRTRLRPLNADSAHLIELEYDGDSTVGPVLILSFSEPVTFAVETTDLSFEFRIRVGRSIVSDGSDDTGVAEKTVVHRQVPRDERESPDYVISLASFDRIPTIADAANLSLAPGQRLFYSEAIVDGATWYRLRLGDFESAADARELLLTLERQFPGAWIDQLQAREFSTDLTVAANETSDAQFSKVDALMEDARRAMATGERSRAIQIYTKVLQLPENARQPEAQEFLALAREKNGQMAHAKAEYERYLSMYPAGDGVVRVKQRLAALITTNRDGAQSVANSGRKNAPSSLWRFQTFFSQYYRRDVNQPNDQEEIVSQSALYSDINFDARRRGERYDFSSRVSAGYRSNFLDEGFGSNDPLRVSYAYADFSDAVTGLRGRIGRQSRNSGGVLGRFDGINLGYQLNENILVNTVLGRPAYSSSDGIDSSRSFYGVSADYASVLENLDVTVFYIDQKIESIQDRQAVGAEFRYFGANQSVWGLVDYDVNFGELASAFLQGSWRFESRLSIHALANRRGSPFLSTGNAIIGQPVLNFGELAEIFSADELIQLGMDRTAQSTNYSIGVSYPMSPKMQVNADVGSSTIDSTPASGGVLATSGTTYSYYSGSLLFSSLLKEGDVSILSARYSKAETSQVTSLTFDSRYPFGRSWRVNGRLRVDRREQLSSSGVQWLLTPTVRIQYRRSQKFRLELEAGKLFSQQEEAMTVPDREAYFVNVGYQWFF